MTVANTRVTQILLKRGNTTVSSTYIGTRSELTHDTGIAGAGPHTVRIHDGFTPGGHLLATADQIATIANVDLGFLANAVSQQQQIDLLNANVAAFSYGSYGNSNVAAYLPNYGGPIRSDLVNFGQTAIGAPQPFGTTDRITLFDFDGSNPLSGNYNYAIGVEPDHVWFANDYADDRGGFKFYGRGNLAVKIGSAGNIVLGENSTGIFWANGQPYSTGGAGGPTDRLISGSQTLVLDSNGTVTFPDNGTGWPIREQRYGMGNVVAWLDGAWTIGEFNGNIDAPNGGLGNEGIRIDPGIESSAGMNFPSTFDQATNPVFIYSNAGGGIQLQTGHGTWSFRNDATLTLPTGGNIGSYGMGWTGITDTRVTIAATAGDPAYLGQTVSSVQATGSYLEGAVQITTGNIAGSSYQYNFGVDGSLDIPGYLHSVTLQTDGWIESGSQVNTPGLNVGDYFNFTPGNLTIKTLPAPFTNSVIWAGNAVVELISTDILGATAIGWGDYIDSAGNIATAEFNPPFSQGNVVIGTGNTGLPNYWTFDVSGDLSVPKNINVPGDVIVGQGSGGSESHFVIDSSNYWTSIQWKNFQYPQDPSATPFECQSQLLRVFADNNTVTSYCNIDNPRQELVALTAIRPSNTMETGMMISTSNIKIPDAPYNDGIGTRHDFIFGGDGTLNLPATVGDIKRDGVSVLGVNTGPDSEWTSPNNQQWYIKTYNSGFSGSYNGTTPLVWFNAGNAPYPPGMSEGYQIRGGIIEYHAFDGTTTTIGTIIFSSDDPHGLPKEVTHSEHTTGGSSPAQSYWNMVGNYPVQLAYTNSGVARNIMIQWTSRLFYGNEFWC